MTYNTILVSGIQCSREGSGTPLQYSCRIHFHFSLSCIGEGNGNPLQCSCLGNLRDRGAWWAAIFWVAQSRTWLKQLSSSSMQCSDFYRLCTKQSWGFSGGSVVKILPDNAGDQETGFRSLGREDPLEKGMATCSSILAGKNPMERGARWATVHGVEKRQTQVSTHTVTRLHPLCHSLVKGSSHNWACTMQSYHNIIDYISCALHYIHVIYLFYNWWFMLLSPFHLFIHSPSSFPLATTSFFSVSVYFCFVLFFFFFLILSVNENIQYLALCLTFHLA